MFDQSIDQNIFPIDFSDNKKTVLYHLGVQIYKMCFANILMKKQFQQKDLIKIMVNHTGNIHHTYELNTNIMAHICKST